jgi:hypothetical protein
MPRKKDVRRLPRNAFENLQPIKPTASRSCDKLSAASLQLLLDGGRGPFENISVALPHFGSPFEGGDNDQTISNCCICRADGFFDFVSADGLFCSGRTGPEEGKDTPFLRKPVGLLGGSTVQHEDRSKRWCLRPGAPEMRQPIAVPAFKAGGDAWPRLQSRFLYE